MRRETAVSSWVAVSGTNTFDADGHGQSLCWTRMLYCASQRSRLRSSVSRAEVPCATMRSSVCSSFDLRSPEMRRVKLRARGVRIVELLGLRHLLVRGVPRAAAPLLSLVRILPSVRLLFTAFAQENGRRLGTTLYLGAVRSE